MERVIVNPREVRGLGDVVSPKSVSDFVGYNAYMTSSTDSTYGTVYNSVKSTNYILRMELECPDSISSEDTSFSVRVRMYTQGEAVFNSYVYLEVNGTVYNQQSSASSFTVSCDGSSEYFLRAWYVGDASHSGCSASKIVYVNEDVESVEVFSEKSVLQSGQTSVLASRVLDEDGKPVKGVEVSFYKE